MKLDKKLTAIIPDVHIPYQDKQAVELCLQRIREERAGKIVILGDLMDFEAVSRFNRKLDKRAAFEWELRLGRKWIKNLSRRFKGAEIHFLSGNHESVSEDTEILCDRGWVRAADVTVDHFVASFDQGTKRFAYCKPVAVSKHMAPNHAVVSSSKKHETVTQNHALIVDGQRQLVETLPDEVRGTRFTYHLPSQGGGVGLSNNYIRFLVWCFTDGCLYQSGPDKVRIQFKLSKQRKIDRLQDILNYCKIDYTLKPCKKYGINKLQPYYIRIYGSDAREVLDILTKDKLLPPWIESLDEEQADVFFDELLQTDGHRHYNQNSFSTTNKHNADMIQLLAVLNGRHCCIDEKRGASGFLNGKIQYCLRIGMGENLYQHVKIRRSDIAIPVVSITTIDDTLITRENGKINFTGNSRLSKYVVRNCPELSGLPQLALDEILEIPKDWRTYSYNLNAVRVDGVSYTHGRKFSGNVCMANLKKYMGSVVQGHSHKTSSLYHRLPDGRLIGAVEAGCLCDLCPSYAADVSWVHAMAWAQDGLPYLEII